MAILMRRWRHADTLATTQDSTNGKYSPTYPAQSKDQESSHHDENGRVEKIGTGEGPRESSQHAAPPTDAGKHARGVPVTGSVYHDLHRSSGTRDRNGDNLAFLDSRLAGYVFYDSHTRASERGSLHFA